MIKSFYFSHDYNASNDSKILFLRQQLGMEGYGIYWFIIEQLAQAGGYLPLKIIPVLAMQSQTQETKVKAVIEGYELFQIVDEQFFSSRLNEHLQNRKQLSEMGKKGAISRWGNSHPINDPNSHPINDPNSNKRKKRNKVNKEIKEDTAPAGDTHTPDQIELFNQFSDWLSKHFPRVTKMKKPITIDEYLKLRETINRETLTKLLTAMENRADLHKKYVSAYLTIINWSKNEFIQPDQRPEQGSVLTALKNVKSKEDAA